MMNEDFNKNILYYHTKSSELIRIDITDDRLPKGLCFHFREGQDDLKTSKEPFEGSILAKAEKLVTGDRQKDYGSPQDCWEAVADLWNIYLKKTGVNAEISAREACDMMILLKVARSAEKKKEDNYVDIAGYAWCGNECE